MIPVNYSKALRRPVPWVLVAASATAAAVLLLASPAWAGGGRGGHDMDAGEPGGMPGMGMGMHPRMLDRMAPEHRRLFEWALHLNRSDSFDEFVIRWAGRASGGSRRPAGCRPRSGVRHTSSCARPDGH